MLRDLAVFAPGFSFASVEAYGERRGWGFDALGPIERLVDSSLLRQDDVDGEVVFSMLVTVREYGIDLLAADGEEREARDAHAAVYADLARRHGRGLGFSPGVDAVARLNRERGNLRAAVRHLAAVGEVDTAADMAWRLYLYWWVGGFLTEVALWMEELLAHPPAEVSSRTRAIAAFYVAWRDMWVAPTHELARSLLEAADRFAADDDALGTAMATATAGLVEIATSDPDIPSAVTWLQDGVDRFRRLDAGWGEALGLVALGRIRYLTGEPEAATELFRQAVAAAEGSGDAFTSSVATHHLARMHLFAGDLDRSTELFERAIDGSVGMRHDEGIAYGLEGLCAIAAARGDLETAAVLDGAAESIRRRTAMFDAPAFVFHTRYLEGAIAAAGAGARDLAAEGRARGREMGSMEAARFGLDTARVSGS